MIRHPLRSVIVKPVGPRCNLQCSYCFYLEKQNIYPDCQVMNDETLDELIGQLMKQSGNSFGITWQGGEPSLAGASFYRKVVSKMKSFEGRFSKTITNSLQTNGYHLTDDLISVLSEHKFLVGLSLDGPKEIHDANRRMAGGSGTYDHVFSNGRKLHQAGIETNILCCITKTSSDRAALLYHFFAMNHWSWLQFIPVYEPDSQGNPKNFSLGTDDWGKFMCAIFDLWFNDYIHGKQAPVIRFIENTFHSHLGITSPECTTKEACGDYLMVEHNGDVYSCDFFTDGEHLLGNIHHDRLIDMLHSPAQLKFGNEKHQMAEECLHCYWQSFCYGGCPKYRDHAAFRNHFCESNKMFLEYSNARFQYLKNHWLKANPGFMGEVFDISGYLH